MQTVPDVPPRPISRLLDAMVSDHAQRLGCVARRILVSEDLAGDAVQDAFVSLWRLPESPPNPEAWLVKAVVNHSLHARRSLGRRRRHERCACTARRESSDHDGPCRALEREEERTHLRKVLDSLAEPQREVLVLKDFEGCDYETIASTLDIAVGTVRSRLSRARAALRARIDPALTQ